MHWSSSLGKTNEDSWERFCGFISFLGTSDCLFFSFSHKFSFYKVPVLFNLQEATDTCSLTRILSENFTGNVWVQRTNQIKLLPRSLSKQQASMLREPYELGYLILCSTPFLGRELPFFERFIFAHEIPEDFSTMSLTWEVFPLSYLSGTHNLPRSPQNHLC